MEIMVLIGIHRIHFQADDFKIFPGDFACLSDIFYVRFCLALPGQNENLLKTGLGNGLHLFFDFFVVELCSVDFVVAVETAVDAVVFTVVCDVERSKHIDGISEMFPCLLLCLLRHLFQMRKRGGREKRRKIFRGEAVFVKRTDDILFRVFVVVVLVHGGEHPIHHVGIDDFHVRKICHMINPVFLLVFPDFIA